MSRNIVKLFNFVLRMVGAIVVVDNFARPVDNGTLVRCAVAMGVQEVCTIGYNSYGKNGARGSQRYIKRSHFYQWDEFLRYLQEQYSLIPRCTLTSEKADSSMQTRICGVLLTNDLIPQPSSSPSSTIEVLPLNGIDFNTHYCFVVIDYRRNMTKAGKNPSEIIEYYRNTCDSFVYVNLPNQANDRFLHDDAKVTLFLQQYAIKRNLPPILFTDEEKHTIHKDQIIERLKRNYQRKAEDQEEDQQSGEFRNIESKLQLDGQEDFYSGLNDMLTLEDNEREDD